MRIRWLRLYDDYNNRSGLGKEKSSTKIKPMRG